MGIHEALPALDRFGFYFFQCLLAFLWQSSLILGPAVLALRLLRKRSPVLRHTVALTGFATIPVILAYSWFLSMPLVPSRPIPVMPEYAPTAPAVFEIGPAAKNVGAVPSVEQIGGLPAGAGFLPSAAGTYPASDISDGSGNSALRDVASFPWALGLLVYLLIQCCLIVRFLAEWGCIRWWIGHSATVENLAVCRVFWRAAHELEVRVGKIEIMECPSLAVPVTVGASCARVLLPRGFSDRCSGEEFRAVVFHEVAHVRRQDPLIFTAISLVRTFLFFHPLVLLIARDYSLIAEQASDEAAIEASGLPPCAYARSLAHIAEQLAPTAIRPLAALALFQQRSVLFRRLESILSNSRRSCVHCHPFVSTAAAAGLAFFLAAAVALPLVERDSGSVETEPLSIDPVLAGKTIASSATACAVPLQGIRIDGVLDDWPKEMARYPIRNHARAYGRTDIDEADLDTSPDCSPSMMVGYDSEAGFLYVAVTVRDDRIVTVRNPEWARPDRTDACEIYVDGLHRNRRTMQPESYAWEMAALQYVLCPGGRAYDRAAWLREPPYSPAIIRGNFRSTGSAGVCRRQGKVTTYEWAVRVYAQYPEHPLRLVPGTVIGFDVAVADKDSVKDSPAWISWGPCQFLKAFDTTSLGDLVLVERYEDLGVVSGRVNKGRDAFAGRSVELYRGERWVGEYTTDYRGCFNLILPPGEYTLKTGLPGSRERLYLDNFAVSPGLRVRPTLRVALNGFTRLRYETAELRRAIKTRRD